MASERGAPSIYFPTPHYGQQVVRSQARRFNWLDAGRRWRKTTLVMPIMVEAVLQTGGEYYWFAPTYKQVRTGWKETLRACKEVFEFNESRMEAHAPNGGIIYFQSLKDYDNVRSGTAWGVEIDEASEIAAAAYYEVILPMLADTQGWLWATFTPKGQNWAWMEHQRALEECQRLGAASESMAWQIPTLGVEFTSDNTTELRRAPHPLENAAIPLAEMQRMAERMPRRVFEQEFLAIFHEDAGGVFRGVRKCVGGQLEQGPADAHRQYVMGVDLAKHYDYTACFVGDLREHRVVAWDRFNKGDWGLQKQRIIALAQRWNNALVWMDTTGIGDPIYDDLRAAGLRIESYKFTASSKEALINNAVLMVEQQLVTYPEIPILLNELGAYAYVAGDSGHLRMSAPEGMHDDCVIAFSLMCWPLRHHSRSIPTQAWESLRRPVSSIGGINIKRKVF